MPTKLAASLASGATSISISFSWSPELTDKDDASMYDLIGDIHGYASELKALLAKMGYQVTDGIWQHPVRKVIFLGNFVDLGSKQIETVHIAHTMVESGNALAVNCTTAWLNGSKPCRFTSTFRNYAPFTPAGTQST
jgi:hypothetical protein